MIQTLVILVNVLLIKVCLMIMMQKCLLMMNKLSVFFKLSGFGHVWDNRGTFSITKLIRAVKNKLTYRYSDYFMKAISGELIMEGSLKNYECLRTLNHLINQKNTSI